MHLSTWHQCLHQNFIHGCTCLNIVNMGYKYRLDALETLKHIPLTWKHINEFCIQNIIKQLLNLAKTIACWVRFYLQRIVYLPNNFWCTDFGMEKCIMKLTNLHPHFVHSVTSLSIIKEHDTWWLNPGYFPKLPYTLHKHYLPSSDLDGGSITECACISYGLTCQVHSIFNTDQKVQQPLDLLICSNCLLKALSTSHQLCFSEEKVHTLVNHPICYKILPKPQDTNSIPHISLFLPH